MLRGIEAFARPEGDVDEADEDGDFDEGPDYAGEGFSSTVSILSATSINACFTR